MLEAILKSPRQELLECGGLPPLLTNSQRRRNDQRAALPQIKPKQHNRRHSERSEESHPLSRAQHITRDHQGSGCPI
jgi:hypothetical protein